jgi:hypothetical protein
MILPSLDRADVKKIMIHLTHHQEQVIFLGEPNLMQSRVREYQLPRDVPKHQSSQPGLLKLISATRLKMNQVDIGDVRKNILCFILSAVECFFLKSSSSRHANARFHRLSWHVGSLPRFLVECNQLVTSVSPHWISQPKYCFKMRQSKPSLLNLRSTRRAITCGSALAVRKCCAFPIVFSV